MAQFSGGYGIRPYGHVGAGIARPQAHCGSHRVPRAAIGRPWTVEKLNGNIANFR